MSVLVLLAAAATAGAFALRSDGGGGDRRLLFVTAGAVRVLSALLISVLVAASGREHLFPDETIFLSEAEGVADGSGFTAHGYSNILGLLFEATGPSAWLPRSLNVVAGALLAVVVYDLVLSIAGRRAALIGGFGVAVWPSLVVWSSVPLKDPFVLLVLFGSLLAATRGVRGSVPAAAGLVVGMALLSVLRPYAFVVVSIALAVGVVARAALVGLKRSIVPIALLTAVGAVGLLGGNGVLGIGFVARHADTDTVTRARVEGSAGNTGFTDPSPESAGDVVEGIPKGLFYTMLGPFPWEARSEARPLLVIELPLWYVVLGVAAAGLISLGWRRLLLRWVAVLACAAGIVTVLAVYEGNAATALRQRGMIIPIVLALAGRGLGARWTLSRRQRPPRKDGLNHGNDEGDLPFGRRSRRLPH